MDSDADDLVIQAGFPHSDIPGSKLVCQLPEAYRRLPRPSSPVAAKASTICAWSLDHITPNGFSPRKHFRVSRGHIWLRIQHTLERDTVIPVSRSASLRLSGLLKNLHRDSGNSSARTVKNVVRGCWWSQPESNRRPPACKAGALPAELWPLLAGRATRKRVITALRTTPPDDIRPDHVSGRTAGSRNMVGLGRFELPTSPLSGVRSNRLSYRPAECKSERSGKLCGRLRRSEKPSEIE